MIIVECDSNVVDIVIVLISSESEGDANWRKMEKFVESLIDTFKVPEVRYVIFFLTYY